MDILVILSSLEVRCDFIVILGLSFKSPLKFQIIVYVHTYFTGKLLWRVQHPGYLSKKGQSIGVLTLDG